VAVRDPLPEASMSDSKTTNKYVIVCNDGTSFDLSRRQHFNGDYYDLPYLLEEGWRPVHETPMGRAPSYGEDGEEFGDFVYVLVLMVKE
jgi:hypothetical protein